MPDLATYHQSDPILTIAHTRQGLELLIQGALRLIEGPHVLPDGNLDAEGQRKVGLLLDGLTEVIQSWREEEEELGYRSQRDLVRTTGQDASQDTGPRGLDRTAGGRAG